MRQGRREWHLTLPKRLSKKGNQNIRNKKRNKVLDGTGSRDKQNKNNFRTTRKNGMHQGILLIIDATQGSQITQQMRTAVLQAC